MDKMSNCDKRKEKVARKITCITDGVRDKRISILGCGYRELRDCIGV